MKMKLLIWHYVLKVSEHTLDKMYVCVYACGFVYVCADTIFRWRLREHESTDLYDSKNIQNVLIIYLIGQRRSSRFEDTGLKIQFLSERFEWLRKGNKELNFSKLSSFFKNWKFLKSVVFKVLKMFFFLKRILNNNYI